MIGTWYAQLVAHWITANMRITERGEHWFGFATCRQCRLHICIVSLFALVGWWSHQEEMYCEYFSVQMTEWVQRLLEPAGGISSTNICAKNCLSAYSILFLSGLCIDADWSRLLLGHHPWLEGTFLHISRPPCGRFTFSSVFGLCWCHSNESRQITQICIKLPTPAWVMS